MDKMAGSTTTPTKRGYVDVKSAGLTLDEDT
jgi:hypothetical protein